MLVSFQDFQNVVSASFIQVKGGNHDAGFAFADVQSIHPYRFWMSRQIFWRRQIISKTLAYS